MDGLRLEIQYHAAPFSILLTLALSFLVHLPPLGAASERGYAATALVLVVNAFTQEPVRRGLKRLVERLLPHKHAGTQTRG